MIKHPPPAPTRRRSAGGLTGYHLGPHCWPPAIRMLEDGRLPMTDICSHQLEMSEFQKGFDLVADTSGASIKVSILPNP